MVFTALPGSSASLAREDRTDRGPGCTMYILQAEKDYGIPRGLLLSLSLVESGLGGEPYPWAINMAGKSIWAESRDDAVRRMTDSRGNIRRNTMAGCMQLSVFLHGRQFSSTEDLLTPRQNVDYAARYLKRHYNRFGDWVLAVKRYNGGTTAQKAAYACRIWNTWKRLPSGDREGIRAPSCDKKGSAPISDEVHNLFETYTLAQAELP